MTFQKERTNQKNNLKYNLINVDEFYNHLKNKTRKGK